MKVDPFTIDPSTAIMFWVAALFLAFLFMGTYSNVSFALAILTLIHMIAYKQPVERAKEAAEVALYNQKARLADSHRPIEVAGQIAIIEATEQVKTEMLIKLKQNEKEIELALAVGNADKVLDFTRKRFQLKKELEKLG